MSFIRNLKYLTCAIILAVPAVAQTLQWARQFATTTADAAYHVAADSSGVYIVGETQGALPGQTLVGFVGDGFLRKYDPSGTEVWTRQFGLGNRFYANAVAVDATGVYVVGSNLRRNAAAGALAMVRKYDTNGNLLWMRQTGSILSGESAVSVALSGGSVYVFGSLLSNISLQQALYLRKFDSAGNEIWNRQFTSTRRDVAYGVAADAGGVFVCGETAGSLTGSPVPATDNLFIRKFDHNGTEQWTRQYGTVNTEYAEAVSVSSSGVYVVGSTQGLIGIQTLPTFDFDAYIRKYDTSGNLLWTRQFGTAGREVAYSALADDAGLYVVGYTGSVLGTANLGGADAFVRRFDSNGNALWTIQTGSVNDDYGYGVAVDAAGIYIGGYTDRASIPETLTRNADSFLHKYSFPGTGAPVILEGGVVSNASFAPHPAPVAPGSIAAIFGTGLNDGSQVLSSSFGPDGRLVTTLGGASVTVGGIAAPMYYSTSGQLGIQIPIELAGRTSAPVQVTVAGQTSQPRSVNLFTVKPGLFTISQDGRGTAICVHSDGITLVTADRPARPEEVVILYGTGLGPLTPPLRTGEPSVGNQTASTPSVTIDGLSAQVLFSGAAPGFLGLDQINVVVPGLARTNPANPLVLSINGVSASAVTLPVGQP